MSEINNLKIILFIKKSKELINFDFKKEKKNIYFLK